MPIRYECNHASRRITAAATGKFRADDILEVLNRMRQDGTWGYTVLFDIRNVTEQLGIPDLRRIAAVARGGDDPPRGRTAIVVTNPVYYGLACAYAALGERGRVEVFRDIAEAHEWLRREG